MGQECDEEAIAKALESRIPPAMLDYLEQELDGREYLVGDSLTVADIAVASQLVNCRHGGETVDAGRYPEPGGAHRAHARAGAVRQHHREGKRLYQRDAGLTPGAPGPPARAPDSPPPASTATSAARPSGAMRTRATPPSASSRSNRSASSGAANQASMP